jgi:ubiquinone/menaquinone biosynthesis C-methylase UbiE
VSETILGRAVEDTRRAGIRNTAYVRGDAQELPFVEDGFDAVCCFASFHLFSDPWRALDRMTAVLTPGGRIALFTTARHRTAPIRAVESLMASRSGAWLFEEREVVEALEQRGYANVRQRVAGVTQFVGGRLA